MMDFSIENTAKIAYTVDLIQIYSVFVLCDSFIHGYGSID